MRGLFRTLLYCGALMVSAGSIAAEKSIDAYGLSISLGDQVTILPYGAMGMSYFPDEAIAQIPDEKKLRLLIATGTDNASFLVEGDDLFSLKTAKKVLGRGGFQSFDNGYAGISGVHRHSDGKLYAFYHAEDHEGMQSLGPGRPSGYYATVAVAESADGGTTWKKLGPVIASSKPKDFQAHPQHHARGVGLPGVTVDRSGRYLYVYYTDQSFSKPGGMQTSVARADLAAGPPVPGAFLKYFQGTFGEPGIGGRETPVLRAMQLDRSFAMYAHPTFVPALDRYVVVFNVNNPGEIRQNLPATISGIYFAHSSDGINWSNPAQLIADYSGPFVGKSLSWQATILWDNLKATSGWLVYGHSPSWGHVQGEFRGTPHYMVGRRISIGLTTPTEAK